MQISSSLCEKHWSLQQSWGETYRIVKELPSDSSDDYSDTSDEEWLPENNRNVVSEDDEVWVRIKTLNSQVDEGQEAEGDQRKICIWFLAAHKLAKKSLESLRQPLWWILAPISWRLENECWGKISSRFLCPFVSQWSNWWYDAQQQLVHSPESKRRCGMARK